MNRKEAFIKIIQKQIFDNPTIYTENYQDEDWNKALEFFEELKNNKKKTSKEMKENGRKSIIWMQENLESMNNVFTSKEIAKGLFTSGYSVSGSMCKFESDGYVEKIGVNPVQ